MPSAMDLVSRGLTRVAAPPATSSSAEPREQTTGSPAAIASATGRPKPSSSEGSTSRAEAAMRARISLVSRYPTARIWGPTSVPPCAHQDPGPTSTSGGVRLRRRASPM